MLRCRELAHRHASDYLDNQLGWRTRLGVRYHLLICEHCRRFIAQLSKVRVLMRSAPNNRNVQHNKAAADPAAEKLALKLADVYAAQKNFPPSL